MRIVPLLCAALPIVAFVGCSPDYSQQVGEMSNATASISSAAKGISDHQLEVRGRYYEARAIVERQPLEPTSGCAGGGGFDRTTCYMAGRNVVMAEAIAGPPGAAKPSQVRPSPSALAAAATNGGFKPRPAVGPAVVASFAANGPSNTPQEAIQKLDVPEACKAQAIGALGQPVAAAALTPAAAGGKPPSPPTEDDVLNAIEEYTNALAAVTKLADGETYNANATKLAASVGKLATTVGALAGGAGAVIGPVAQAVVKLGEDAALQILERRRFEALKAAVLAECIPFHNLALAEAVILTANEANANHAEEGILTSVQQAPRNLSAKDRDRLDALATAAAANVRARASGDPGELARKLYKLHNQLVLDVLSGKGGSEAFVKAIGDLAPDVKALKDAVAKKNSSGGTTTSAK